MKALNGTSIAALQQFAAAQAQWHGDVKAETCKLLVVQGVTQPNSRSTVELHRFAVAQETEAQRWTLLAGGAR